MTPTPPIPQGRAIPLLLLCIGYFSIIPFGAVYIAFLMPDSFEMNRRFALHDLIPVFGLALILGYSTAVGGRQPWGSPKVFWALSCLYNLVFCLLAVLSVPMDFRAWLTAPLQLMRNALQPNYYDPQLAWMAVTTSTTYFVLFAMPLVAALSALELHRASKATRESHPASPEPAR